jgi:hypothetical protein
MAKNRIMIYGPKTDGTYVVEFRTADGEALARPAQMKLALMSRINIFWAVIAILLVLLAVTRYVMHEKEISHICADDPSAPECQR